MASDAALTEAQGAVALAEAGDYQLVGASGPASEGEHS
jgi:hypothetical protein